MLGFPLYAPNYANLLCLYDADTALENVSYADIHTCSLLLWGGMGQA